MAHYAKVEDGIVTNVVVCDDDWASNADGLYIKTSYNTFMGKHALGGTPLRLNYACIGDTYDEELDAFIRPRPEEFPSFILNKSTGHWETPIPYPLDKHVTRNGIIEVEFRWNEEIQDWEEDPDGVWATYQRGLSAGEYTAETYLTLGEEEPEEKPGQDVRKDGDHGKDNNPGKGHENNPGKGNKP